jgi:integrase
VSGTFIVERNGRFNVVAYAGVDPATGKKRKKWSPSFATRREAQQYQATLAHSPLVGAGGFTRARLGDYLDGWIRARAALMKWRPKTLETARIMAGYLKRELGHLPLPRLSPAAIEAAYTRLLKDVSAATVLRAAETLRTALEDALRQGIILRNVARQAMLPPVEEYEPTLLTPEQLQAYLADARASATPAIYGLWATKATTGLRLGELLGLHEDAVDLAGPLPTLTVERQLRRAGRNPEFGRPKTRHGRRVILLSELAVDAIRGALRWNEEQKLRLGAKYRDSGLVFCGPTGRPLNPSNVRSRDHYPRLQRVGLPKVRPHDIRHWNATELDDAGVSDAVMAARMGHGSAGFTRRRYVHPRLEAQRRAAEIVDMLLRPGRSGATTLQPLSADTAD